jgi:hypothetical protein
MHCKYKVDTYAVSKLRSWKLQYLCNSKFMYKLEISKLNVNILNCIVLGHIFIVFQAWVLTVPCHVQGLLRMRKKCTPGPILRLIEQLEYNLSGNYVCLHTTVPAITISLLIGRLCSENKWSRTLASGFPTWTRLDYSSARASGTPTSH